MSGGDAEQWARVFDRASGAYDNDGGLWRSEQRDGDSTSSFVTAAPLTSIN